MHKTLSQKKLFGLISCSQNLTNSFSSAIFIHLFLMKGHFGFLPCWYPLHVGLLCFSSCRLLSGSGSCVITVPVMLAVVLLFQGPNSGTDRQGTEQSVSWGFVYLFLFKKQSFLRNSGMKRKERSAVSRHHAHCCFWHVPAPGCAMPL